MSKSVHVSHGSGITARRTPIFNVTGVAVTDGILYVHYTVPVGDERAQMVFRDWTEYTYAPTADLA